VDWVAAAALLFVGSTLLALLTVIFR